ncbi:MAG: GWxTD domain-containing protein [Ignavibacterium sp.]|nr:GWxTD domain-containing protein [Ignavibacterium sp.]MDW8375532.1 GWxTD domain-containing protein [Ignavibacteriales bacterium]
MKKILIFVLILFYHKNYSQSLGFDFDYAQFGYDSSSNFVEFYYVFEQSKLSTIKKDDKSFVEAILKVTIVDSSKNDTIVNNRWVVQHELTDQYSQAQSLVGVISFIIPKGVYKCLFEGQDLNSQQNKRTILEYIRVNPFRKNDLSLSDIQIGSKMIQGSQNTNSVFYKNTFEITPIPNLVFGENQPVLFFYTELYNLDDDSYKIENFKLNQIILNSRGKIVLKKDKLLTRKPNTRVEVGSFVVAKLPTDTYTLIISVLDTINNVGVNSSKRFFVYNPKVSDTDTSSIALKPVLSSTFGAMSEEELDDIFAKSKYIATANEIDKYSKLKGEDSKREFLFDFWNSRDDNLSTPENEFFYEYIKRIDISNQRFNSMQKQGWKTDRGRVYMIYGEPSEIERYPNQIESRPYEIWYYNDIEGGVYFIFADLTGFSEYTLVHSTKRGELRDENWGRRIIIAK